MYGDMNAIMTQRAHKSSTPLIGKAQGSSKGKQGNLGKASPFQRLMAQAVGISTENMEGKGNQEPQMSLMNELMLFPPGELQVNIMISPEDEQDLFKTLEEDDSSSLDAFPGLEHLIGQNINYMVPTEMNVEYAAGTNGFLSDQAHAIAGVGGMNPDLPNGTSKASEAIVGIQTMNSAANQPEEDSASAIDLVSEKGAMIKPIDQLIGGALESTGAKAEVVESLETEKNITIDSMQGTPLNQVHHAPEQHSDQQAIEKAEPYNQISKEITSTIEQKGPMEFKMQLEPEDLGKVDIKLKLNQGKLVIDIMAASAKTQAMLTGQVDKLIQSIGLTNVQVESVQVSQGNQQGYNDQHQAYFMNGQMDLSQRRREQSQQQSATPSTLAHGLEPQEIEALTLKPIHSSRMDYMV
jgi:hypothetical protein